MAGVGTVGAAAALQASDLGGEFSGLGQV
ncbi:hypothetical protein DF3PB_530002 [uncultured Defluviicoccus sp.]|uniref:Uncharacterized protein n=1 Tax=metagenome TaxID=256318 RepID=A0A380TJN0_9ZZZZ|nr:hypothetical protein DF3PB_530002 [uncultured Defluviicoccus sp.]